MTTTEDASIRLWRDTSVNWTAADPVLADGEPGYETNTGLMKIGNGVDVWSDLGYFDPAGAGGGGGSRTLLADTLLAATAASIDFSSISATYDDLEIVFTGRVSTASAAVLINLTLNNDTTDANYGNARLAITSSVASTIGTGRNIGIAPGSTVTAGKAGTFIVSIPDYRGAFDRQAFSRGSAAGVRIDHGSLMWFNTAAINRLTLAPSDGSNFIAGTRARLYGLKDVA